MVRTVSIDPDLCAGNADCVRLAPGAFALDETRGVAVPLDQGVDLTPLHILVQAARQCPTNAIRVTSDDGAVLVDSA